jgi:hypothetical protein
MEFGRQFEPLLTFGTGHLAWIARAALSAATRWWDGTGAAGVTLCTTPNPNSVAISQLK